MVARCTRHRYAKRIEQLGKGFRGGRRPIKGAGVGCVFEGFFLQFPVVMASPRVDYEGGEVRVYVINYCKTRAQFGFDIVRASGQVPNKSPYRGYIDD